MKLSLKATFYLDPQIPETFVRPPHNTLAAATETMDRT